MKKLVVSSLMFISLCVTGCNKSSSSFNNQSYYPYSPNYSKEILIFKDDLKNGHYEGDTSYGRCFTYKNEILFEYSIQKDYPENTYSSKQINKTEVVCVGNNLFPVGSFHSVINRKYYIDNEKLVIDYNGVNSLFISESYAKTIKGLKIVYVQ